MGGLIRVADFAQLWFIVGFTGPCVAVDLVSKRVLYGLRNSNRISLRLYQPQRYVKRFITTHHRVFLEPVKSSDNTLLRPL